MTQELTHLERDLVDLVAREHWPGFRLDGLRVAKRENTGAGRFVYIEDHPDQHLPDGLYGADGRLIEIPGVPNGLGWVIAVTSSRIDYIEVFTYGNVSWDGTEDGWRIV